MAGVGLTWYTWFEQGRDIQVSEAFLLNVARALELNDAECRHLFMLAHKRPLPPEAHQPRAVSERIRQMLEELPRPAYVLNLRWDVIAWNERADALWGFGAREPEARNLLRLVFLEPELRHRLPSWDESADGLVAQLRQDHAIAPEDPAMRSLVDELGASSGFRTRWEAMVEGHEPLRGVRSMLDPEGVRLDFQHETLTIDEDRHLRLVVYFAETGGASRPS